MHPTIKRYTDIHVKDFSPQRVSICVSLMFYGGDLKRKR
nr:MAG TPA: hypothetical protein [Caudoviricetes sp.]